MPGKELIRSECNDMHDRCITLAMYYYHVTQRMDLGADVTETLAILTGILDGINSDTANLRKLLEDINHENNS